MENLREVMLFDGVTEKEIGLFHKWVVKKDENSEEINYGLIESSDGKIKEVKFNEFRFLNRDDVLKFRLDEFAKAYPE